MYIDDPVHDWSSHPADAWRTVALTWKASKIQTPEEQNKPISTRGWTWGQATKHHFERRRALREGAF
jgi:hypothetical protein